MRPVRLKERICLQFQAAGTDDAGHPNGAWTDYRNCWAKIEDTSGTEGYRNQQVEHVGTLQVKIRYPRQGRFPDVRDRVVFTRFGRTRTVELVHVQEMGDRFLMLHCKESP